LTRSAAAGRIFRTRFGGVTLRHRFEDLGFGLAATCLRLLPIEPASWLSGQVWRRLGPRLGSERHKRALENLAIAFPEKSLPERAVLAAAMWENLGRTFAESFRLAEIAAAGRVRIEAPPGFDAPEARVLCAAHQANWEVAVFGVPAKARAAGVYQRIKNPLVEERVLRMRSFLYPGGLYPKTPAALRHLIRHAREGGTLAVLADQRDFRGPRVAFFGAPAPSTPFPAMVARSLGIKLYAGEIVRQPHVRFTINLVEIILPQTEDREADIVAATAALQAEFERTIRLNPDQWMWSHRRWG
jgi:KDO2-lipid IV(A) lauroyltransferase